MKTAKLVLVGFVTVVMWAIVLTIWLAAVSSWLGVIIGV